MDRSARIFVAGHRGMMGAAICRSLKARGFTNLLLRSRDELDLTRQQDVDEFFSRERPELVFLAAAKVGGIRANGEFAADFIRENLLLQTHVIDAAYRHGTRKLLFLGSSCIYPRLAAQPISESALLTGPLEPTNQWYAVAKIAGLKMAQAYRHQHGFSAISVMPTNLYGPGDNFNLESAHVMPALIRRFHEAKLRGDPEIAIWGTGAPLREFLHVQDAADACVFLMDTYDAEEPVNVGCGEDLSIAELASLIAKVVGYEGCLGFDASKPDGTPRKLLDVQKLRSMGWMPRIGLREGIESTYRWFLDNQGTFRR